MVRHTTTSNSGFIWLLPSSYTPNWKIDINGVSVTNFTSSTVSRCQNNEISSYNGIIDNTDGVNTNKWTVNQIVNVYADYTTGIKKIFKGRLYRVQPSLDMGGRILTLFAKGGEAELLQPKINKVYTNIAPEDIAEEIINNNATDITYTKVATGYIIDEITFSEQGAWSCIVDAFRRANHDCHVDEDWALQHFERDSEKIDNVFITHGINIINVLSEVDLDDIKNKVKVYGGLADSSTDVQYLVTKNDTNSQTDYGVRIDLLNVSSLETEEQIKTYAAYKLSSQKDLERKGNGLMLGDSNLVPGKAVRISSPYEKLNGEYYRINKFVHTLTSGGFLTSFIFTKQSLTLARAINQINTIERRLRTIKNVNNMTNSKIVKFDEQPSVMSHVSTEEVDSILTLETGQTNGTATSNTFALDENVGNYEIRIFGEDLSSSIIKVSNNGGINYDTVPSNNTDQTFSSGSDKQLKFQINLVKDAINLNPRVFVIGIMTR